jgi:hypothetical protein
MTTARSKAGRRIGVLATLLALGLVTMTGVAYADPGNGNGAANASDNANGKGLVTADSSSSSSATSGDTSQPQPPSNADFSGNGANTSGSFDSTRNGSPSLNGSGNGQATGKPCAGCVGKADNKNPLGQSTGDKNKGYECDDNNGIGKTNPAHTGCAPETPIVTPVTPPVTPPVVLGETLVPPTEVLGVSFSRSAGALALTGGDVAVLVEVALIVMGLGVVMVAASRRRPEVDLNL